MLLLRTVKAWAPFKIDALGIVTLLGADGLQQAIGRLVSSPYAEYLPLLAANITADNSIANALPGFVVYNITDGIKATDLSAWWTRWLICQQLTWNSTTLQVRALPISREFRAHWFITIVISILLDSLLVAFPIYLGDWYGFASSIGIMLTIISRVYILSSYRQSLDRQVIKGTGTLLDPVKLFITLPNGKAVSVLTTRGIAINCFLTEVKPKNHQMHLLFRAVNWAGFGVLVVALGMACLCMQLILVVVMLVSSTLMGQRVGCDERHIGCYLQIDRSDATGVESRVKAYSMLNLNEQEEQAMLDWHLYPLKSN